MESFEFFMLRCEKLSFSLSFEFAIWGGITFVPSSWGGVLWMDYRPKWCFPSSRQSLKEFPCVDHEVEKGCK